MKECVEPGNAGEGGTSTSASGVKSSSSRDFLDFPTLFVNSVCLCKALPRGDTNKDTNQISLTFEKLDFSDKKKATVIQLKDTGNQVKKAGELP